jgi:predicted HTH domain antitoxin
MVFAEKTKARRERLAMTTLAVSVPDELLELLGSEEAAREHLRRAAVLDLVKRQAISQGRGAELLGMSLWEFRDLMAETDVPVVDLAEPEPKEGYTSLKNALSGSKS